MALKHADLIAKMTLEEKASMCDGLDYWHSQPVDRLGIKSVSLNDGPHGIRKKGDPEAAKKGETDLSRAFRLSASPRHRLRLAHGIQTLSEEWARLSATSAERKEFPFFWDRVLTLSVRPFAEETLSISRRIPSLQARWQLRLSTAFSQRVSAHRSSTMPQTIRRQDV